ncbi:MAG: NFACT family protein [Clostridia bacterium]|nr:NFACT family protein [Clostridia bacterium]
MSYDGLMLYAVKKEIEPLLQDSRVGKVFQPQRLTIVLLLHKPQNSFRVLISAGATDARLHLTTREYKNPDRPPSFCMVLRKYLDGARLVGLEQVGLDRVLSMIFDAPDPVLGRVQRVLKVELMGKHSNLILINRTDGLIIDAIKKYDYTLSRHRQVLPGLPYVPPPKQDKLDPLVSSYDDFTRKLLAWPEVTALENALSATVEGLSRSTAREIIKLGGLDPQKEIAQCGELDLGTIWQKLQSAIRAIASRESQPTIVSVGRNPKEIFPFRPQLDEHMLAEEANSLSELLDRFYGQRQNREEINSIRASLKHTVNKNIEHCSEVMNKLQDGYNREDQALKKRLYGDLILMNLGRITIGDTVLWAENPFSPDSPPEAIPLDPQLTPSENAQRYYRAYSKYKRAAEVNRQRMQKVKQELEYLQSVLQAVEDAESKEDLTELTEELRSQGYIPPLKSKDRASSPSRQRPGPRRFVSSDGFLILVGKNNLQNEHVTFKISQPQDLWLHARGIPGAHVIIRSQGKPVPPQTLMQAAQIAAYYSQSRQAEKVEVDYTEARYIRKPKGLRPGLVTYSNEKTILVKPELPLSPEIPRQ